MLSDVWSEETVKLCKKWLSDADDVFFKPLLDNPSSADIRFGKLVLRKQLGNEIEMTQELISQLKGETVPPPKFSSWFNRSLSAVVPRWDDNGQCGNITYTPDMTALPVIGKAPVTETMKMRRHRQEMKDKVQEESWEKIFIESIEKVQNWLKSLEGVKLLKVSYNPDDDLKSRSKGSDHLDPIKENPEYQKLEEEVSTDNESQVVSQPFVLSSGPPRSVTISSKRRSMRDIIADCVAAKNTKSSESPKKSSDQDLSFERLEPTSSPSKSPEAHPKAPAVNSPLKVEPYATDSGFAENGNKILKPTEQQNDHISILIET